MTWGGSQCRNPPGPTTTSGPSLQAGSVTATAEAAGNEILGGGQNSILEEGVNVICPVQAEGLALKKMAGRSHMRSHGQTGGSGRGPVSAGGTLD